MGFQPGKQIKVSFPEFCSPFRDPTFIIRNDYLLQFGVKRLKSLLQVIFVRKDTGFLNAESKALLIS